MSDVINTKFDNNQSKEWLKGLLREGVVTVNFTKKDGTPRTMKCTLSSSIIPVKDRPAEDYTSGQDLIEEGVVIVSKKKTSVNSLAVFDTEANGWRSFRWDSIDSLQFDFGS
jgi:hypothetical protein